MFASPVPFVGLASPDAEFIGITELITTAAPLVWPTETAAGHFAVAFAVGTTDISETGWTGLSGANFQNNSHMSWMYKTLVAGDISSPPTISIPTYGGFFMLVYNGPTLITLKTEAISTGGSVTVQGFARTATSKFVMACGADRDPLGPLAIPDGFTLRADDAGTYYNFQVSDQLSNFYNEQSVVIDLINGTYGGGGALLELT